MTPGFTTHKSSHGRKQKRTLNTTVSPWEMSDTYSQLQMSALLINNPKIWSLGIRFLKTALNSQHSLAESVLQNRQEIVLLISEQRDMSHPSDVNLKLANAPTSPCYAILMLLMNVPCTVNCLTCLVSAQVKVRHAAPVQQRYKTTANHGKHQSPLDGHRYKDSEA